MNKWNKHRNEFPEFSTAEEYTIGIQEFLIHPPNGTLTKTRPNGDMLLYHPATNTFVVKDESGSPRTMFRPKEGVDYWHRQQGD